MSELNQKLRRIYQAIEDSGLYINLNHDVRFHEKKEVPLNLNETESIVLAEESYNSPLLFALLTAVLRNGTMILYGSPGSGKTTSAEYVGAFVHGTLLEETFGDGQGGFKVMEAIHEATIHGHHELTEEKMIGRPHLGKLMRDGEEDIIPRKFMLSPFRMVDEVNRLTPGRTNNLLEMMDRGFSVYGDSKIYAAEGATFLTANFRDVASSDLTPPFLDRIDVGVFAPTLNPYFLEMAQGGEDRKLTGDEEAYVAHLRGEIGVEITARDLETMRGEIAAVEVEAEALYILYNFISELNGCALASPDIERKNKGFAWFVKPPVLCSQVDDGGAGGGGHLGGCHYHNTENICYKTENEVSVRGQDHRALRQGPGLVPGAGQGRAGGSGGGGPVRALVQAHPHRPRLGRAPGVHERPHRPGAGPLRHLAQPLPQEPAHDQDPRRGPGALRAGAAEPRGRSRARPRGPGLPEELRFPGQVSHRHHAAPGVPGAGEGTPEVR